ncbi:MAG TPA: hypothetical protein VF760_05080, partial [Xanthobacteraceae bacterium]
YIMSAFPDRRFWARISEVVFLGWNMTRLTARPNREVSHPFAVRGASCESLSLTMIGQNLW